MAEYTYKDIIIDPDSEEAKNAIGKEVYFADTPASCLNAAKNNNKAYLGYLKKLDLGDEEQPFYVNEFVVSAPSSWTCIIVKKEPSYSERAKKWVEANDIKVGDYVKVTRKANENEHGWKGLWLDDMDESVAKTLMVKNIGIYVYTAEALKRMVSLPVGVLEARESLEQLRALENGMTIRARIITREEMKLVVDAAADVNTPAELEEARKYIK